MAAIEALRASPEFATIAQRIRTEGLAAVQGELAALMQQHPEVAAMFRQNPQAIIGLLQQMVAEGGAGPQDAVSLMIDAARSGGGGGGHGGGAPPGAQVVRLTEAEREAVERLTALGFSQQAALQAYMACDKQEELAANFLFDNGMDES